MSLSKHRKAWLAEHEAQEAKRLAQIKTIPPSPHELALEKERLQRIQTLCGEVIRGPWYELHCDLFKITELCNLASFFESTRDHGRAMKNRFNEYEKLYGKDSERKQKWELILIEVGRIDYEASYALR